MKPLYSSGKKPESHNALPNTGSYRSVIRSWNKAHQGSARAFSKQMIEQELELMEQMRLWITGIGCYVVAANEEQVEELMSAHLLELGIKGSMGHIQEVAPDQRVVLYFDKNPVVPRGAILVEDETGYATAKYMVGAWSQTWTKLPAQVLNPAE